MLKKIVFLCDQKTVGCSFLNVSNSDQSFGIIVSDVIFSKFAGPSRLIATDFQIVVQGWSLLKLQTLSLLLKLKLSLLVQDSLEVALHRLRWLQIVPISEWYFFGASLVDLNQNCAHQTHIWADHFAWDCISFVQSAIVVEETVKQCSKQTI